MYYYGSFYVGDKIVEKIHETGIPYVAFGRLDSFPELSYATVDYEEAAYISTKFFIKKGHKDIALVQAFNKYQPGVERFGL
jgi:DNA-binding LacI/PurR family transcriptional regulator